jgi:hypothetical protein
MDDSENPHTTRPLDGLLAGLASGVVAVLSLLSWLALASAWYRRSIWTTANIMATTFYGEAALRRNFTFRTLAGLALYVVVYGTIGALFGISLQTRGAGLRLVLVGVLVGLGWYYFSFVLLWRKLNPLITLYTHSGPMIAGHMLYGGLLACFPRYLPAPPKPTSDAG